MPTVPQYGDRQVSTAPLNPALQNPNIANADAYGASIAQNIDQANRQKAQIDREMKERRIEVDVLSGINEFMREDDNARNGQNGFMLRQGENARTSVDEYDKFSNDLTERVAKKYKDPETQDAFRRAAQQRIMSNRSALVSRTGTVLQKHEIDTKYAAADTDRKSTLNNFWTAVKSGDAELITSSRAELQASIDRQKGITRHIEMDLNGSSVDEAEIKAQAATNATISSATLGLLQNGNYREAKSLYDSFEGQLDEETRRDLFGKVQHGVANQQAQDSADEIMNKHAGSRANAYMEVEKIKDAGLRQRTQTLVDAEFSRMEVIKTEQRGKTYEAFALRLDKGELLQDILAGEDARFLDAGDKQALLTYQRNVIARKMPEEFNDRYYEIRREAAMKPGAFLARDLRLERGNMAESDRARLIELHADMQSAVSSSTGRGEKTSAYMNAARIAEEVMTEASIPVEKENGVYNPDRIALERQLDAILDGGNYKNDEIRKIAKGLVAKYRIQRTGMFGRPYEEQIPAYKILDNPKAVFPELTDEDVVNIRAVIDSGKWSTEEINAQIQKVMRERSSGGASGGQGGIMNYDDTQYQFR